MYAVRTTGVYCRPSCAARRARPENVRFFDTNTEAEQAGFRACKRCVPNQVSLVKQNAAMVAEICRLIETAEEEPSLRHLAYHAGLSVFHFHRVFRGVTGVTPKQYAAAHRARQVRRQLSQRSTITSAAYAAGYNSSGRFYAEADGALGMTPALFRAGGAGTDIRYATAACTMGSVLVAQSERGVCAILLGDEPKALVRDLQDRFPKAKLLSADREFETVVAAVVAHVEAPGASLALPLDIRGTVFQQRVWRAIQKIPPGATANYSQIAKWIGAPKSARAVAQACAANTLAVAIPCHRVVRRDGDISGYRWGVDRKRALLKRESSE